jgi:hypothetical protein
MPRINAKEDLPTTFFNVRLEELDRIQGPISVAAVKGVEIHRAGLTENAAHLAARIERLRGSSLTGLALSGGGIRSATFSLGVLQALAERRKLASLDYLSTVSGGGYIGSFLSAWIHRHDKHLQGVEDALAGRGLPAGEHEAKEVTWLRQYSNYLAPKLGMLSADSMTLVATWLRNVFLNLIVLVSMFVLAFLSVRLTIEPAWAGVKSDGRVVEYIAGAIGLVVFPLVFVWHLIFHQQPLGDRRYPWTAATKVILPSVLVPGMIAALLTSLSLFSSHSSFLERWGKFTGAAAVEVGIVFVLWVLMMAYRAWQVRAETSGATTATLRPKISSICRTLFSDAAISLFAGVVGFGVSAAVLVALRGFLLLSDVPPVRQSAHILTFGPPALLIGFGISGSVFVGIIGRAYFERSREWWSRLNAWFISVGFIWFALFWLTFYAVPMTDWALANSNGWLKAIAGTGWLGSLVASLLIPKPGSPKTIYAVLGVKLLDLAATVVVVGFLLGVAYGTTAMLEATLPSLTQASSSNNPLHSAGPARLSLGDSLRRSFDAQEHIHHYQLTVPLSVLAPLVGLTLHDVTVPLVGGAALTALLIFGIFGWRVDVNKFSLHNLYKNRLIRCYLGASRIDQRRAQPFTGFDEEDDVDLTELVNAPGTAKSVGRRPLHLVNTTLNLTQGTNLAWQQRKAASFTFSPLYCGFSLAPNAGDAQQLPGKHNANDKTEGYRPTSLYGSEGDERKRISLGSAMATSGAAVSPNMGQASTAARAFVLTLFNLRIGRWSANPMQSGYRNAGPTFGVACLLQELLGFSDEKRKYVYLSDGGHFENTGVYELVRRKCKTIIAVDAGGDYDRSYEDLAELVRKCRVDLGADIRIDLSKLGVDREANKDCPGFHEGTIHYPAGAIMPAFVGKLVVIKPTRLPLEKLGADLYSYARKQERFPQQSTADQFFDESQFESYRALGKDITLAWLDDEAGRLPAKPLTDIDGDKRGLAKRNGFFSRLFSSRR